MYAITSFVLNWILLLALFPISFIWLRRAWRIARRRDYSEIALKGGLSPKNPEKYAPVTFVLNLVAALVLITVIFGALRGSMGFSMWTAWAGSTIWGKIFFEFMTSRHAHFEVKKKEKTPDSETNAGVDVSKD